MSPTTPLRRVLAGPALLVLALAAGCGGSNWTSTDAASVGPAAPSGPIAAAPTRTPHASTPHTTKTPASGKKPSAKPTTTKKTTPPPTAVVTAPTTSPTTAPGSGTVSISGIDPGIVSVGAANLEWVEYNDPSGVALSHPRSWTITTSTVGPVVVSIDGAGTDPAGFRRTVNLLEQPLADGITATDYLNYTLAQISESGGVIESSAAITLDRVVGRATTWHTTKGAVAHRFLSVSAVRGQLAFLVTYSSDANHFATPLADVKRLLASIRLPPVS